MKKLFLSILLSLFTFIGYSQLFVHDTLSQIQMVEGLEGPGVTFSNITVNCPGGSDFGGASVERMGQFDGSMSNIGIDAGLIISSGVVDTTLQSNDDNITQMNEQRDGDPDLDLIVVPDVSNDACIIEFDLKMSGDTLRFNYVFASEEYPEFVNSFNDVFAFFISGPGISGPFSSPAIFPNGSKNIAILPDGVTPVTINNINNGDNDCFSGGPNGPCMNCQYYVDNCGGPTCEYDGFTTILTAKTAVLPCETYHLKLAIGDVNDWSLESSVFLQNNSFASAEINFGTAFTDVFEGCTEGGIDFNRKDTNQQDSVLIYFSFGGTATNGIDYGIDNGNGTMIEFPDSLILPPGTNSTTLNIIGDGDGTNEEDETIVIYVLIDDCVEGRIPIDSIVLTLHDFIYLDLFPDTLVCPGEEVKLSFHYDVDSASITDFTINQTPTDFGSLTSLAIYDEIEGIFKADTIYPFSSLNDTVLIVSITDSFLCVGYDTLIFDVLEPELTDFIFVYDDPSDPSVIQFVNQSQFPDGTKYSWDFGDSSGTAIQKEPLHVYPDIGTYTVSLSAYGDGVTDCPLFKDITIKPLDVPNVITPNGDGINDVFEAYGMYQYDLTIYNRWGKKVYNNPFYENTFNGDGLSDGTYYYLIDYPFKGYSFKGWFKIMR